MKHIFTVLIALALIPLSLAQDSSDRCEDNANNHLSCVQGKTSDAILSDVSVYVAEGNYSSAIEVLTNAINQQPEYAPYYYVRGQVYVQLILANENNHDDPTMAYAASLVTRGNRANAIYDFQYAIELDPDNQTYQDALNEIRSTPTNLLNSWERLATQQAQMIQSQPQSQNNTIGLSLLSEY